MGRVSAVGRKSRAVLGAAAPPGQNAVDRLDSLLEHPAQPPDLRIDRGEADGVAHELEAENGLAVLRHQSQEPGAVGAHPLG